MTGEPVTTATLVKSIGEAITAMWSRGALFLWCLSTICFVVLMALGTGTYFHLGDASTLLASYGISLLVALLVLVVSAGFKTFQERSRPILSLIPNERQSIWTLARQTDGRVLTTFGFRFQAANMSNGTIVLSGVRVLRPRVRRRSILQTMLYLEGGNADRSPIMAQSLSPGSGHIVIDHPVGRVGKRMRIVLGLQDHAGRWHRMVFRDVPVLDNPA